MRLKPALIMLVVFMAVIAGLAVLVSQYNAPTTDELIRFNETELFPDLSPAEIVKVEFRSPMTGGGTVVIERTGAKKWRITHPFDGLARSDEMERLVTDLAGLDAPAGYATNAFDKYDLDEPAFELTATTAEGVRLRLSFGTEVAGIAGESDAAYMDPYTGAEEGGRREAAARRYARIDDHDQVLVVNDVICPQLDVRPEEFREARLLFAETPDSIEPVPLAGIRAVSIVRPGDSHEPEMAFREAPEGGWRILAPVEARADVVRLATIAERLLGLQALEPAAFVAGGAKDLAALGLAESALVVSIEVETTPGSTAVHEVRFGTSPAGRENEVYAQSSSRPTVLIVRKDGLLDELRGAVATFRDHRLTACPPPAIESVTLEYGETGRTLTVRRMPDDPASWVLEGAVNDRADPSAARDLANKAVGVAVVPGGFVDDPPGGLAQYGLDRPRLTVRLASKNRPEAYVYLIGDPTRGAGSKPAAYAKNAEEPHVVLIPEKTVGELSPDADTLRDKRLLAGFDRWGAFRIEIDRVGEKVRLRRPKGQGWEFVEPEGLPVDYVAPADFLGMLAALEIQAWPADRPDDYGPFGLSQPWATVSVKIRPEVSGALVEEHGEDAGRTFVIAFGNQTVDGSGCYVRLSERPNVYIVDAQILEQIAQGMLAFRDRLVLSFDPEAVVSVSVRGGRVGYVLRKVRGGVWMMTEPFPGLGDSAAMKSLMEMLDGLAAEDLVAADDLSNPTYGLRAESGGPYRRVQVIYREEQPPPAAGKTTPGEEAVSMQVSKTLLVGGEVPGGEGRRYAALAENGLVFVMGAQDVEKLEPELASTNIINILSKTVAKISITHRDGSAVEIERKDGAWRLTSHNNAPADARSAGRLADAAGWVDAACFVAYADRDLSPYGFDQPLLTVKVTREGKVPTELVIGGRAATLPEHFKPKGQKRYYYATGGGVPAVFLLDENKVRTLAQHVEDLIDARAVEPGRD